MTKFVDFIFLIIEAICCKVNCLLVFKLKSKFTSVLVIIVIRIKLLIHLLHKVVIVNHVSYNPYNIFKYDIQWLTKPMYKFLVTPCCWWIIHGTGISERRIRFQVHKHDMVFC